MNSLAAMIAWQRPARLCNELAPRSRPLATRGSARIAADNRWPGSISLSVGRPAVGRQVRLTDPACVVETGTVEQRGVPSPPSTQERAWSFIMKSACGATVVGMRLPLEALGSAKSNA